MVSVMDELGVSKCLVQDTNVFEKQKQNGA
jgi:hypothetical protein